jgi:hypothetical protein
MKKPIMTLFAIGFAGFVSAQVQIDKPIQMIGSVASDRAITNLSTPINSTDGVNKAYVDNAIASVAPAGTVPVGGIIIWSGAANAIPSGWVLCDGTNATPNLRDRFVIGAGNTYAVGATGGSSTFTPSGTIGGTALTIAQIPAHTHGGGFVATGFQAQYGFSGYGFIGNSGTTTSEGSGQSHTHSFTGTPDNALPPYYALCYIMRVI